MTAIAHAQPQPDRRRHARLSLLYPVKLMCLESGRYLSGHTKDLSAHGTLLQLQHPTLLRPGQRVRVGIAWHPSKSLLKRREMLPGVVVRSLGIDGHQTVAISFDVAQLTSEAQFCIGA